MNQQQIKTSGAGMPQVVYYCIPESKLQSLSLFRYTRKHFIELLFDVGRLRLNSLKVYRAEQKADSELNVEVDDRQEGKATVKKQSAHSPPREKDFSNGFMNLSTSLILSEDIRSAFEKAAGGTTSYGVFEITNPVRFGQAIAEKIHATYPLQHIIAGKCDYVEQRTKLIAHNDLTLLSVPANESFVWSVEAGRTITQDVVKVFFLKEKALEHQCEFRYLWKSEDLAGKDYIDIDVPDALKYCRWLKA